MLLALYGLGSTFFASYWDASTDFFSTQHFGESPRAIAVCMLLNVQAYCGSLLWYRLRC